MTLDEIWPHVSDAPNFRAMCRVLYGLGVLDMLISNEFGAPKVRHGPG